MSDDERYVVQIYAGDVGGHDFDIEVDTEEEALAAAVRETPVGARPTEIYLELDDEGHRFLVRHVEAARAAR